VLTLAFGTDPMARWALPDAHVYLKTWPLAVRAFGGRAFGSGSADVINEGGGAALTESSNPRTISRYERHGFVRLGVIQAGESPEVVPMLRRVQ
jgi:hypothetical protein